MHESDGFPLAAQSCFSLLRGVLTPESLVNWAVSQGLPWVGMADRGNFYGLVRFVKAARAGGIKPVAGMHFATGFGPGIVAWCLDATGFRGLNALASQCLDLYGPHPPAAGEWPDGAASATGQPPAARPIEDFALAWWLEHGWQGLALAVPPGPWLQALAGCRPASGRPGELLVAAWYGQAFLPARRAAAQLGLEAIALNPGVWRDPAERRVAGVLRAVDLRRPLGRLAPADLPPDATRLVSAAEMRSWFVDCPEMLASARCLAERADTDSLISAVTVFPAWEDTDEPVACAELERRCREGIARRYPDPAGYAPEQLGPGAAAVTHQAIGQRLAYELDIIRRKGFSSYFLVVNDIVAQAPRTCGRGSAAASLVSYLLGITHVDPLAYKLFFERFLNDDRRDPPDIDVDFPWDERERVLAWVFARYPGRAAMVADHVTFAARSALREVAIALGYPDDEVDRFARMWISGQRDLLPAEVRETARSITGLPRYIGLHPGGVVITPRDIHCHSHVQTSLAGWPVLAWEKDATEDAGLVKIDLLGNRSLAVLRDSLAMIRHKTGQAVDWAGPDALVDPRTRQLVESGQTLGVFYVESPATRQLLRKMGSADYEHLVVASSIIRPAANRYINEYVRRLHGGDWRPLHPLVADVLADTLGIMVYQEDVSRVAIAAAGFSAGEADGLRKVLSRKDREARLALFYQRFREGAAAKGVGAEIIQALWDMILSFDGYSFCKSHSASYALVSYKLAWVRTWHPLEFFTAVINNGGGFYSRQVYLNEVRRLGFPLAGPDLNASVEAACIRGGGLRLGLSQISGLSGLFIAALLGERQRAGQFRDLEDFIARVGPGPAELRCLIRSGAVDSLAGGLTRPQLFWVFAGQRDNGAWRSSRTARQWQPGGRPIPGGQRPPQRNARSRTFVRPAPPGGLPAAESVGVGSAPPARGQPQPAELAHQAPRSPGQGQGGLFPLGIAVPACIGDYLPETKLADEMEFLGLLWSRHPLEVFSPRIARLRLQQKLEPLIDSRQLGAMVGRLVSIAGTIVAEKEVWTRKADTMSFVSFEDPWGMFETVLFPDAWQRLNLLLIEAYAFIVQGRVQEDSGALTIQVDNLIVLNRREG